MNHFILFNLPTKQNQVVSLGLTSCIPTRHSFPQMFVYHTSFCYNNYLLLLYVQVYEYMKCVYRTSVHHSAHIYVRGQFCGVSFLLPHLHIL